MLAIGRCLMGAPELVMFDEPSLGWRRPSCRACSAVRDLNRDGLTCVLVEQNVAVSLKLASHAYVLENGRITLSGTGERCSATTGCGRLISGCSRCGSCALGAPHQEVERGDAHAQRECGSWRAGA